MPGRLRAIATPFVVAPPMGARIRTRLRLSVADQAVLREVGEYLGRLAGQDLGERCRLGHGDGQRTRRKRLLTSACSSRWAGAITRTSQDQWQRGYRNLLDERAGLRRAIRHLRERLAAPVGGRAGRARGYASRAERWEKQRRLDLLTARLAHVEGRIAQGRVSLVRGGRRLLRARHQLDSILAMAVWRQRWQAARWFLTADGDAAYPLGNGTIMVDPKEGRLELKLPTPLTYLANRPQGRYRLSCSVSFSYRTDQWAAQVASGAVRYDFVYQPERNRWYLDTSWTHPRRPVPTLAELSGIPRLAVDLNARHLDCTVLDPAGNPIGTPHTIPLDLDDQCSTTRDGRLRAAISQLVTVAKAHGCRSIAIEDLDFADARAEGRETLGRGRRGKRFRRTVAGIPTRRFRDRLVQMCANQGLWVVAVDPAYTSRWGRQHWQVPLQSTTPSITVTVHHAAAVVIGRRSLGYRARRRPGVPPPTGGWVPGRATGQASHGPGRVQDPTRPRGAPAAPPGTQDRQRQPGTGSGSGGRGPFAATRQPPQAADARGTVDRIWEVRSSRTSSPSVASAG
jgi:IS605 OrfB family transposase